MNLDLTAEPKRLALALALQIGKASVVTLCAPAGGERGALYRDDEEIGPGYDEFVTVRRRRGESNIKFAVRVALKFSEVWS